MQSTNNHLPARTLQEIAAQTSLEPLQSGDPRYVDMASGRGTRELRKMRVCVESYDAQENRYAKIAFTGHRGCGKSTELLRLEHDLAPRFTCLHLYVDENLIRDCDYTDLMLWMTDALVRRFAEEKWPLRQKLVDDVVNWFAERTLEDIKQVKSEITSEVEAEAQAKWGLFGTSLKILARIKARMQGNIEKRSVMRHTLQNYSRDLVDRVNSLLDDAQNALEKEGKSPDLLVVQDNLDRLPVDVGRRLFFDHGDLLKQLRVHVIFTVPIAMLLAPWDIGKVFENAFTMPMVKVHNRDNSVHPDGIDALLRLIAARVDLAAVFSSRDAARLLVNASGGSVRDLLRLLNDAQLEARTDAKSQIDEASAQAAIKNMRIDFERMLLPIEAYFPILRRLHATKVSWQLPDQSPDARAVDSQKEYFSRLLFNGTVLEYNGDQNWYDVHPIVQQIEAFRNASDKPSAADGGSQA